MNHELEWPFCAVCCYARHPAEHARLTNLACTWLPTVQVSPVLIALFSRLRGLCFIHNYCDDLRQVFYVYERDGIPLFAGGHGWGPASYRALEERGRMTNFTDLLGNDLIDAERMRVTV